MDWFWIWFSGGVIGGERVGEVDWFWIWFSGGVIGGERVGEVFPPASEFIRKAAAVDMRPFSLNSLMQLLSFSA